MVLSSLLNTLNKDIADSAAYIKIAPELWVDPEDHFFKETVRNFINWKNSLSPHKDSLLLPTIKENTFYTARGAVRRTPHAVIDARTGPACSIQKKIFFFLLGQRGPCASANHRARCARRKYYPSQINPRKKTLPSFIVIVCPFQPSCFAASSCGGGDLSSAPSRLCLPWGPRTTHRLVFLGYLFLFLSFFIIFFPGWSIGSKERETLRDVLFW